MTRGMSQLWSKFALAISPLSQIPTNLFLEWCEDRRLRLERIDSVAVLYARSLGIGLVFLIHHQRRVRSNCQTLWTAAHDSGGFPWARLRLFD
jgi:hypothetical protein